MLPFVRCEWDGMRIEIKGGKVEGRAVWEGREGVEMVYFICDICEA